MIILLLTSSWFIVNLILAVINDTFHQSSQVEKKPKHIADDEEQIPSEKEEKDVKEENEKNVEHPLNESFSSSKESNSSHSISIENE